MLGQAVTIASRYGVTRRQGPVNQQIIDYQSQHVNLLPIVSGVYVYRFAELALTERWNSLQALSLSDPMAYVSNLPDIHAISAGIKATGMWWLADSLELCRRACGGHAYSAYNAIAGHLGDMGVLTTGGGDNYPMAQQLSVYEHPFLFFF
jgi:acyl-CoA oxidase